MALVNPLYFVKKAQEQGFAIAAFNVHNLETVQAVVEAAHEEEAPVIIQTTPGTVRHAGEGYLAAMVKVASDLYDIPIALHLDHCEDLDMISRCIQIGYTSVMFDGSRLPYDQNVALTKEVVELAHKNRVAVEAELGKITGTEDDLQVEGGPVLTDPEEVVGFLDEVSVDYLAIAIGTAHGVYVGEPKLDFDRLEEIRNNTDVPLVLHGASGVPDASVIKAIQLGICKVNIATELKIPMAEAIKSVFRHDPQESDPRRYMGEAKLAVKHVVKEKIRLCGGSGKIAVL